MPRVRLREPVLMGVLAALAVALWKAEALGTVGDAIGLGLIVALKAHLILAGFSYLLESGRGS